MWWHALDENRMLFAEVLELRCHMAPVAIENQEAVPTNYSASSLRLKFLLKVQESKLIGCPAVLANCNPPSGWQW